MDSDCTRNWTSCKHSCDVCSEYNSCEVTLLCSSRVLKKKQLLYKFDQSEPDEVQSHQCHLGDLGVGHARCGGWRRGGLCTIAPLHGSDAPLQAGGKGGGGGGE